MTSNGPSGPFFASPTQARKPGKQGGSSRKRKVAGSRPPPTWVASRNHVFPSARRAAIEVAERRYQGRLWSAPCFPGPRSKPLFASSGASPAPIAKRILGSSFSTPICKAHRQHKPERVGQSHESVRGVEAGCTFVERIDHDHRGPNRASALERALQRVGE